ncbi:MAG: ABC transporter permease, partial [Akkermansiaceae bacterium]|nr:ABC transporter permease [Akkermansiaceae bacterium]
MALGVLVLLVVLAVMAGFEREVKSRILGFTPHVMVQYAPEGQLVATTDWQGLSESLEEVPGVTEAYAYVRDNAILDSGGLQKPVFFRAIDTSNEEQTAALEALIAPKYGGTAAMGLDEKAVLSETTAKSFGIQVGDTVQIYSGRNFDEVFRAYKLTERASVAEEFAAEIAGIKRDLDGGMTTEGGKEVFAYEDLARIYGNVLTIHNEEIRPGEREILARILEIMNSGVKDESGDKRILESGSTARMAASLDSLGDLDMEKEDARVLKDIREIVLPKDLEVVGIYQASQHVLHPDLFVPLPTGQELKGLIDGVDGVALRLEDAYRAGEVAQRVAQAVPPGFVTSTWMDQYREWFSLIRRERSMMKLVLGFITLGSAFSVGAVMLLLAIQKKREIGVLLALGARPGQICWVFLFQGALVGLAGSLLGLGLSVLVVRNRGAIQESLARLG